MYVYTILVDVVWDPEKAETNLKKHGIRFADTEMMLSDPNALTREDIDTEGEHRFVTVRMDSLVVSSWQFIPIAVKIYG